VLPLFVNTGGKGHQIAIIGTLVTLGNSLRLALETQQPNDAFKPKM
jgi:hypothetical protein